MAHPTITITAKHGEKILVDKAQAWKVLGTKWSLSHGYAAGQVCGKRVVMHRMLMNAEPRQGIDHINRNKLDNRLAKLRFANQSINGQNAEVRRGRRYRGAYAYRGQWLAAINKDGKQLHLGYHKAEESAARAYDAAAKKLYPGTTALNFPND